MSKYKVDLVAKLVGFCEIEVEAKSELEARQLAYEEGQKLAREGIPEHWDIQYVDYHNSSRRNRDGTPICVYEVDINEINGPPTDDEYARAEEDAERKRDAAEER